MSESAPVLWFTGLSGAGKTTVAREVLAHLQKRGIPVDLLDGDEIREELSSDLGFSKVDRDIQVKRLGYLAHLLSRNGVIALVSAISPYRESRDQALSKSARAKEIFVDAPIEEVQRRDTKGLYKKALAGEIVGLTGVDDPYEAPLEPDLRLDTQHQTLSESVNQVLALLAKEGVVNDF